MTWTWLALAGLGAFHGLNPAMGWLFAVALGLHRHSRATVLRSLVPIALGHALAIGPFALALMAVGVAVDGRAVRVVAGAILIGWAAYHHLYGNRHRTRIGMRAGFAGLTLWSFLMASAHGAGLMLVPVLLPMSQSGMVHHHGFMGGSLAFSLAAVGVHTLAMLVVTGAIAVAVYDWVGLAFLRRGWVNLDWLWTASLVTTGCLVILLGPAHR